MTAELDRLEADVLAARGRLSAALGRLVTDAAPTTVGASAAHLGVEWTKQRVGDRLADWLRERPVASIACLAGLMLAVNRLAHGPRQVDLPQAGAEVADRRAQLRM